MWRSMLLLTMMAVAWGPAAASQDSPFAWLGPDGRALPFSSEGELVEFLRHARVVKVHGQRGSVQAWVEGVVTEDERERRRMTPPDPDRWTRQWEEMELFDQIVSNLDRNQGNLLVDEDWRLWLVDHTLAFRRYGYLEDVDDLERVERGVWQRLQALDESTLRKHLEPFLEEAELQGLVERIGGIAAHFRGLIRDRGESAVVYDDGRARD